MNFFLRKPKQTLADIMTLLAGMIILISFRFNCDYEEKTLHYWVLVKTVCVV